MLKYLFSLPLIFFSKILFASKPIQQTADTAAYNFVNDFCKGCSYALGEGNNNSILVIIIITILFSFYLFFQNKRKLYLFLGFIVVLSLLSTSFLHSKYISRDSCEAFSDSTNFDEFVIPGDEFVPMDDTSGFIQIQAFEEDGEIFSTDDLDEFSLEIEDISEAEKLTILESLIENKKHIIELLTMFSMLIIIGLLFKKHWFWRLRPLFLVAMLVWLGFIHGGCPCMISSFQNMVLAILGVKINWVSLFWFLGLIPLTYFFGKIWCGWLCHLGALQEFLFSTTKLEILKKERHQKMIKYFLIVVFVILIAQLIITRTNVFIHYDPFKVAFNLFSAYKFGYVLLVILLALSALIYRPFCRGFCPVGLIMGWITLIPGAMNMNIIKRNNCSDCSLCSKTCKSNAISYKNKVVSINNTDCIACGDCAYSCKKNAFSFSRKEVR